MPIPAHLTPVDIAEFGREIEAIRNEVMDSRGERDARYIYRLIKIQRSMSLGGRIVIYASLALLPQWGHAFAAAHFFWPVIALGTLMLGCAKILETMEIGHNISHAQWELLAAAAPDVELVAANNWIETLRQVKTPDEIERVAAACAVADAALERL